jgi:hypothetical protein
MRSAQHPIHVPISTLSGIVEPVFISFRNTGVVSFKRRTQLGGGEMH